jgi:hypothetical protein
MPALLLIWLSLHADKTVAEEPRYEAVHRKGATALRGLILDKNEKTVRIFCIQRRPGRPAFYYTITVPRSEVRLLEELKPEEHKRLAQRVEGLKREREGPFRPGAVDRQGDSPPR